MESIKLICKPMVNFSKYSSDKKLWSIIITQIVTSFLKKKKKKKCNLNVTHIYIYICMYVFMCVYFNKFTVKLKFTIFSCVSKICYKTN